MTWVDVLVLGVIAVSGLLAFLRGFVREVLGIGAWIGAAIITYWGEPIALPRFQQWLGPVDWAQPVAAASIFIVSLIVLLIISSWIGALVRGSALGGLDRTLGLAFGLVRGAVLVVVAYIGFGFLIPPERWPNAVTEARLFPVAQDGAAWAVGLIPANFRPHLPFVSPGQEATVDALLHAIPQGRATGRPTARE
jgi:membrane protein required for colicin V production